MPSSTYKRVEYSVKYAQEKSGRIELRDKLSHSVTQQQHLNPSNPTPERACSNSEAFCGTRTGAAILLSFFQ